MHAHLSPPSAVSQHKCHTSNNKGKHFWETIKPFMTNNVKTNNQNITLYENNSLISNPNDVCNIFNEYYINVTQDFCEPDTINNMSADQVIAHYKDHPSVKSITKKVNNDQQFDFKQVTQTIIEMNLMQANKASGLNNISPKFSHTNY